MGGIKGANFHKCDFQVHTPRDPGWQGAGAVTDDELKIDT
jgi:type III restriction enzyme